MPLPMPYEAAVYLDDAQDLTDAIVEVVRAKLKEFPDNPARASVTAAALATAANMLDNAEFNPTGVTGKLRAICLKWPQ